MTLTVGIFDDTKAIHQATITLADARLAEAEGYKHIGARLNELYPTAEGQPTAAQQLYHRLGVTKKGLKLQAALDGISFNAGAVTEESQVSGRLAVMAYLMDTIEDKLLSSDYGISALFNRKAASIDTIPGTKFDRPILNYDRPEAARSKPIAQLSEPASMLTLTTSDKSFKVSGTSIGMEISDEAAAATSLALVSLSMGRQAEVESLERIERQLLAFLNGDVDYDMAALATISGAVKTAKSLDAAITVAGNLTQTAWVSWLFLNSRSRKIDTVITDFKGALAIQNRTGRPIVTGDNGTSKRIDTLDMVVNPTWPDQVDVIISQDPNWPANTLVGFDSRYGYQIVSSTSLSYKATEEYAMRRSQKLRVDSGSASFRLFDEAWAVLTLTV